MYSFNSCFNFQLCTYSLRLKMSNEENEVVYTTNDEDQRKAAELQVRLAAAAEIAVTNKLSSSCVKIPSVKIDEGAHKYVLISAKDPGTNEFKHFVTSRRGAAYHRNVAEPFVHDLEDNGFTCIEIKGGGRVYFNEDEKKISIFGYSYGFGRADHAISREVVLSDNRYSNFSVTWSNDGY